MEHVIHMGERRLAYSVVGRKPEGKRPLGRPRCIWEDNIKMDVQEEGWGAWAGLIWLSHRNRWQAVVNMVMNLQVP